MSQEGCLHFYGVRSIDQPQQSAPRCFFVRRYVVWGPVNPSTDKFHDDVRGRLVTKGRVKIYTRPSSHVRAPARGIMMFPSNSTPCAMDTCVPSTTGVFFFTRVSNDAHDRTDLHIRWPGIGNHAIDECFIRSSMTLASNGR